MKKDCVKLLANLLTVFIVSGCVGKAPRVTPCSIVNIDTAECRPPDEPYEDKTIYDLLGYTCFSPDDLGDMKAFVKKQFEKIKSEVLNEINRY